jgi:putative spermidine/putrescine transport system ATP-binding protein
MANAGGERVEILRASKSYGSVHALRQVTLDIAPGEFVSLLGPSGSGKTTLLGILGGFITPSSGAIRLGGRDVTNTPPHKRGIGIVFQNYALFPHLSVAENVAFSLRARKVAKAEWAPRVAEALTLVDLGGFEARRISQLSGGQRQRVALARAIIFEPRLILMDEPLSALDKQLREAMQIELRQLHRRLDATIVYVTHDQREALTMSDRVAILKDGRLVQIDQPEVLHDRPANAFVASFIGEATLLPVMRAAAGTVKLGDSVLRTARALPQSGDLVLAIQTEKLLLDGDGSTQGMNRLTGTVTDIVYQGESLRVFIALAGNASVSLRQPSHHAARARIPNVGAPVHVSLHPEDTIVVPASSD